MLAIGRRTGVSISVITAPASFRGTRLWRCPPGRGFRRTRRYRPSRKRFKVPLTNENDIVAQLQKILGELAANPEQLERLRRQGIAYVRERLTWEAKAQSVTRVLQWAVGQDAKPNFPPPKSVSCGRWFDSMKEVCELNRERLSPSRRLNVEFQETGPIDSTDKPTVREPCSPTGWSRHLVYRLGTSQDHVEATIRPLASCHRCIVAHKRLWTVALADSLM